MRSPSAAAGLALFSLVGTLTGVLAVPTRHSHNQQAEAAECCPFSSGFALHSGPKSGGQDDVVVFHFEGPQGSSSYNPAREDVSRHGLVKRGGFATCARAVGTFFVLNYFVQEGLELCRPWYRDLRARREFKKPDNPPTEKPEAPPRVTYVRIEIPGDAMPEEIRTHIAQHPEQWTVKFKLRPRGQNPDVQGRVIKFRKDSQNEVVAYTEDAAKAKELIETLQENH